MKTSSRLYSIMRKTTDILLLDFLFFMFSGVAVVGILFLFGIINIYFYLVLLLNIGPAYSAFYSTAVSIIMGREQQIFLTFWNAFISSYKKSILIQLIFNTTVLIIVSNLINIHMIANHTSIVFALQIIIIIQLIFIQIYILPIISINKRRLLDCYKEAFFMANRHFFTTITILLLTSFFIGVGYYLNNLYVISALVLVYGYMVVVAIRPVIQKYMEVEYV